MSNRNQRAQQVRFRPPIWSVLPQVLLLVFICGEDALRGAQVGAPSWLIPFYLAFFLPVIAFGRWCGLVLTPTHAIIYGFRIRRIPWVDVQDIEKQPFFGAIRIELTTADGRSIKPRAPYCSFGIGKGAFERDYHRIEQWWQAHHSPQESPDTLR